MVPRRLRDLVALFIFPAALLSLWEVLSRTGDLDARFFPPPSEIGQVFWRLLNAGELQSHIGASFYRIIVGFILGAVPAVSLGMLMGLSPRLRVLLLPTMSALYTIPKIALVPLFIIIFGLGEGSRIYLMAFSIFFLVLLTTMAGVMNIDKGYLDVARKFKTSRLQLLRTVAFPGALPSILTGVRLGLGFGLIVIVGIEFIAPRNGIGSLIWQSYQIFDLKTMYAGLFVTAIMALVLNLAVDVLEQLVMPWKSIGYLRWLRLPSWQEFKVWFWASRPFSYTASIIPVLVGSMLALYKSSQVNWALFAIVMAASIAIHAGTNLANEYFDHLRERTVSGSVGAFIQRGLLTEKQVLAGTIVAFGIGAALGAYLMAAVGWPILFLGLLSFLAGFFYSAGPLASLGLGELTVFMFMGPVMVMGSYYVQTSDLSWPVFWASIPVAFLVAAILQVNNIRDIDEDRQVGKRTLATLIGRRKAELEFYLLICGSYLTVLVTSIAGILPLATLITLLTFPTALSTMRGIASGERGPSLNIYLKKTAGLHLQFGLLLTTAIITTALLKL